jgi:hypothetical protein
MEDEDPAGKAALIALADLGADGVLLTVQGGRCHGNTAVVCDPEHIPALINQLKDVIAMLESTPQELLGNPQKPTIQ